VKRHRALESLSRDHHHALLVAQRLKRATEPAADEARSAFLDYWEADGREHFREEEEVLLPALAHFADPEQPVIARVLIDHVRIRRFAAELADAQPVATLHGLGEELEQHVRREERGLFPLIEHARGRVRRTGRAACLRQLPRSAASAFGSYPSPNVTATGA
jgi:iron-sulfur cluster repair protein YtfE (RIC family)